MRFSPQMAEAVSIGLKTETRRPITASNVFITGEGGADWWGLDLTSLHPIVPAFPVAPATVEWQMLAGRCKTAGSGTRSVVLAPRVRAGDVFWAKHSANSRDSVGESMVVKTVRPSRLHDITEEDAIREGVAIFGLKAAMKDPTADVYELAYWALLETLTQGKRNIWVGSDAHAHANVKGASPRDCFALLWATLYGPKAWRDNPWVWVYAFDLVRLAPSAHVRVNRDAQT